MLLIDEYDAVIGLIDESYRHWTGEHLSAPESLTRLERLHWLHTHAPSAGPRH
ncbi:hypothetical protein ABIA48_000449 [Pseudomonas sp. S30_BP2TU TE3576]|uniref:hypothetical protein n=1 Tax=Pseudomonas sp. S30_BP2TU TE3576 TaxID=3349329 RepID=UPI003D19CF49